MSRSSLKRALATLRRLLRRRRVPRPSEQEWLRLILLVRRLQRGQLAFAQRMDEIRALTGVLGSFRSDVGALHEQLSAARESAGELERGLAQRVQALAETPDPGAERAAFDQRLERLDALSSRLETIAGQTPTELPFTNELADVLARLDESVARHEALQQAESSVGGQDELARLYERIQELAETVGRSTHVSGEPSEPSPELGEHFERLSEQLERLEAALQSLPAEAGSSALEEQIARLEKLSDRPAGRTGSRSLTSAGSAGFDYVLARFEALAERLEQTPAALPELPAETMHDNAELVRASHELEEMRAKVLCEQESRRRFDAEMEAMRSQLRGSELARVELETRHSSELAQVADHARRKLLTLEEDLKKKKRGLSELTQQNITLQNALTRLQGEPREAPAPAPPPPAALPRGGSGPLAPLMQPDVKGGGEPAS